MGDGIENVRISEILNQHLLIIYAVPDHWSKSPMGSLWYFRPFPLAIRHHNHNGHNSLLLNFLTAPCSPASKSFILPAKTQNLQPDIIKYGDNLVNQGQI